MNKTDIFWHICHVIVCLLASKFFTEEEPFGRIVCSGTIKKYFLFSGMRGNCISIFALAARAFLYLTIIAFWTMWVLVNIFSITIPHASGIIKAVYLFHYVFFGVICRLFATIAQWMKDHH